MIEIVYRHVINKSQKTTCPSTWWSATPTYYYNYCINHANYIIINYCKRFTRYVQFQWNHKYYALTYVYIFLVPYLQLVRWRRSWEALIVEMWQTFVHRDAACGVSWVPCGVSWAPPPPHNPVNIVDSFRSCIHWGGRDHGAYWLCGPSPKWPPFLIVFYFVF